MKTIKLVITENGWSIHVAEGNKLATKTMTRTRYGAVETSKSSNYDKIVSEELNDAIMNESVFDLMETLKEQS